MKKVMSPENVAHTWAHQHQNEARNPNDSFYFNGKTIYSYGPHFPIASLDDRKGPKTVIYTLKSYSITTTKHKSIVWSAISHLPIVLCAYPKDAIEERHTENIEYFESSAKEHAMKLSKARKPEIYLNQIADERQLLEKYCHYFNIDLTKKDTPKLKYINIKSVTGAKEATAKEQEQLRVLNEERKKAQAIRAEKELEQDKKNIAKWKRYSGPDSLRLDQIQESFLRVSKNKENIETTKGIEMPLNVGLRFYKWLLKIKKSGGCKGDCTHKILGYDVNEVTDKYLHVGCHIVEWKEIDKLAKKLNWIQ